MNKLKYIRVQQEDGNYSDSIPVAVQWSNVENKPTTIAGYGITDIIAYKGASPINLNGDTFSHGTSGVTAGTYRSVTVDSKGHVIGGTNPTTLAGYGITDAEYTSTSPIDLNGKTFSHANSGVTEGTYKSVTVDAKGHVTSGSNPTTLSDYGITDAYTKTQVDNNHYTKTQTDATFYKKTEIDTSIYTKAQIDANFYKKTEIDTNIYTKTQTNNLLDNYYTKDEIDTSIYTKTQTDALLNDYYTKDEIDTSIYTKTQVDANIYTKTQTNNLLSDYYTKSYIDANFYNKSEANPGTSTGTSTLSNDDYYTKTQTDNLLSGYYTKTQVDTNFYTKTDVDSHTGAKVASTNGVHGFRYISDTLSTYDSTGQTWNAVKMSATNTVYSNTTSGLTATTTQGAIDEIASMYQNALASVKSVTIPSASSWTLGTNSVQGSDVDHYYTTVTVTSLTVTSTTKVDLEPDVTTIAQMILDETHALWIETEGNANDGYTLYAHCIGNPPSTSLTIQCICSEVII